MKQEWEDRGAIRGNVPAENPDVARKLKFNNDLYLQMGRSSGSSPVLIFDTWATHVHKSRIVDTIRFTNIPYVDCAPPAERQVKKSQEKWFACELFYKPWRLVMRINGIRAV
jgi:hypothetical protein